MLVQAAQRCSLAPHTSSFLSLVLLLHLRYRESDLPFISSHGHLLHKGVNEDALWDNRKKSKQLEKPTASLPRQSLVLDGVGALGDGSVF